MGTATVNIAKDVEEITFAVNIDTNLNCGYGNAHAIQTFKRCHLTRHPFMIIVPGANAHTAVTISTIASSILANLFHSTRCVLHLIMLGKQICVLSWALL